MTSTRVDLRPLLIVVIAAALGGQALLFADEVVERALDPSDREHWSFQPVRRPEIRRIDGAATAVHPIDAFLEVRMRDAGLAAVGTADRATLLRRLCFDLTGLPPTIEQQDAFLADASNEAYDRLIDRLLASPAYGERWAQHWLDLARFAETDGFEHDKVRPEAWRYRDWVIRAFNDDLPYDEFVRRQIAGDELHPDNADAVIATGFLLCGPDMPDINDQDERRHTVLNELTGTVGAVFLGLPLGCAQCHDHKTDPVSQHDFYRLRAFFESGDVFKDHPLPVKQPPPSPEVATLREQRQQLEDLARQRIKDQNPDQQPSAEDITAALTETERAERKSIDAKLSKLPKPPPIPQARVFWPGKERPAHLAIRGDFRRKGPTVEPAFLKVLETASSDRKLSRADLAQWLTRPDHPLAMRVIVNRLWQFHFGEGLVRSPSDFGLGGAEPSHPELLDWLATELPRRGWSLKEMHRLIVTSAAYRRAARPGSTESDRTAWRALVAADPDNRLWGRMSPRRLDGEAIRDAMLSISGELSERRNGPGVRPPLPTELVSTLLKGQWDVSPNEEDHRRRSVYLFVRRNLRYPLFEVFDRPDTNASCDQRT
ncbi:MAG: DUF1549 and DUF1553 domain-containing protein, partial [Planctomycetaceae bacterium]|nr:DUF1549 and DUF1553 domain-containing protein [Planctomycetaceae bacterium]